MLPADAAEVFFLFSGFHMAFILDRRYRGPVAYRIFIRNRVLPLYPIYAVALVSTLVLGSAQVRFRCRTGLGLRHYVALAFSEWGVFR